MDDLRSHRVIMGSTRLGMSAMPTVADLVTRTVTVGVLGEQLLTKPQPGVRRPISPDRKAKARKATKAAAKSRRRNRQ